LLTALLLPLATPRNLTSEEEEELPIELQYLDNDKAREQNLTIRKLLLETLTLLCSTREARVFIREQNIYPILREYHREESDDECRNLTCSLVDMIMRDEGEEVEEELSNKLPPPTEHEAFTLQNNIECTMDSGVVDESK
jgi:hypothetical protein